MKTNKTIRNILAIIVGLVIGSAVNMGLILVSGNIIPPPPGADLTTSEGIRESMHLLGPRHYIFPFLAHALGTLTGAFFAALIAATQKMKFAMAIGVFFMVGGVVSVFMIPAPLWFILLDLSVAYIPMAWIGSRLAILLALNTGATSR